MDGNEKPFPKPYSICLSQNKRSLFLFLSLKEHEILPLKLPGFTCEISFADFSPSPPEQIPLRIVRTVGIWITVFYNIWFASSYALGLQLQCRKQKLHFSCSVTNRFSDCAICWSNLKTKTNKLLILSREELGALGKGAGNVVCPQTLIQASWEVATWIPFQSNHGTISKVHFWFV